jgi:hypothetical protein
MASEVLTNLVTKSTVGGADENYSVSVGDHHEITRGEMKSLFLSAANYEIEGVQSSIRYER